MIENTENNVFATAVLVNAQFGNEITQELWFRRIRRKDHHWGHEKWGKDKFTNALESFNEDIIVPFLFYQLLPSSRRSLKTLIREKIDVFLDIDEDGNEYTIAKTPFEAFELLICSDIVAVSILMMKLSGHTDKTIKDFMALSDEKKNAVSDIMKKMITQELSPSSQQKQGGLTDK